jgi:response regulator RpfG family c-di-GMP phosphodiesterase/serine/threonine protein kinase
MNEPSRSSTTTLTRPTSFGPPSRLSLDTLIESSLVLAEDLEKLSPEERDGLLALEPDALLSTLMDLGALTEYQADRIGAGTTFGLVLGNYRVLDRLGAGGMGVVFRAEHMRMRKQVAIKVLPFGPDQDPRLLHRFLREIRAIAQLQHPNIVGAIDAGEASDKNGKVLHFFVMEYVPGQDLEEHVRERGPLAPTQACDFAHQVASALAEANKHNLVHRDLKPSNIQVTPEGQAKLLDFGLARSFSTGLTEHGTLLGTLDYMAPEQVQDAHAVDIRADLYALGGVLYWCLTGAPPFPPQNNLMESLVSRLQQQPPSVRAKCPEAPPELERVIHKLMALNPNDRYPTPQAVMRALMPFLKCEMGEHLIFADSAVLAGALDMRSCNTVLLGEKKSYRALLVDDEPDIRIFCKYLLQADGIACDEAPSGAEGLRVARAQNYDVILLDVNLGDMAGPDVCRELRAKPPCPNLKIIMASGMTNSDTMAEMLLHGADDFITKPFSVAQLQARVKALLRLKDAQDRTDLLKQQLLTANRDLEKGLSTRDSDLAEARNALVLALANLVEHRANENGARLVRLRQYIRVLGAEAARGPAIKDQLDDDFIELIACCAPLHDLGKVGLPDHILLKPSKLDAEERLIMQTHTTVGAEMLHKVATSHPSAAGFLHVAIDIARHHHERFDGGGYPDRLSGANIPLAARLVAICDVYDALRSRRTYKPALSHSAALQVMGEASATQFDPDLLEAFQRCAGHFEKIHRDNPDSGIASRDSLLMSGIATSLTRC